MSAFRALQLARVAPRMSLKASPRAFSRLACATPRITTPASRLVTRQFSVSARTFSGLAEKIKSELDYEVQSLKDQPAVPDFLQAFKSNGVWEIQDVEGNDEVILHRKYNNENIKVIISIADLEEEPEFDAEEEEAEAGPMFPLRCTVSVSKPNGGALSFETTISEGVFSVQNITHYKDSSLATELSSEADWKRRGLYLGPQFEHLDPSVQEEFENFLSERGVDESLAAFLPEYAEWKEQQEYVKWLKGVKTFVEA